VRLLRTASCLAWEAFQGAHAPLRLLEVSLCTREPLVELARSLVGQPGCAEAIACRLAGPHALNGTGNSVPRGEKESRPLRTVLVAMSWCMSRNLKLILALECARGEARISCEWQVFPITSVRLVISGRVGPSRRWIAGSGAAAWRNIRPSGARAPATGDKRGGGHARSQRPASRLHRR